ncbi:FliI/YscN family ATPase [Parvularcula lutaonensis]|uniref:FliI/YscN family ATPase n=1 Tax=Parvularcula lutaonensis TaxID=491923 RepID=A0ABV7MCP4_9PROT|nr:FliI/YscN family ATPase [Parvularcula lutaonensis]GGY50825.1 flagellum-specific ATP synthase [Parvularcula lutaonensis]
MSERNAASRAIDEAASRLRGLPGPVWEGEIASALGMVLKVRGLSGVLSAGDLCTVERRNMSPLNCQVVGVEQDHSLLMSFADTEGVAAGARVTFPEKRFRIRVSDGWLGRVIGPMAQPIDGKGPLPEGPFATPLKGTPPPAFSRRRVGDMVETGVKAIDAFTPICRGQRMGIFAGSGVGKSTLLSMLARSSAADVNVIGLIGERGREVQEFLQRDLGEEGLARSIVIVATSDESPLARRQAAYLTMAVAEDQRKRGRHVFCMMDSVTRFAHALREIGLAVGEPPSARGFPPSVFGELAHLLERSGPGMGEQGDITLAATVLVDGDDHEDPVADAVRGILDGHLKLTRTIATRGRFPAIDVPGSVSRLAPDCYPDPADAEVAAEARRLMSVYEEKRDIISIGLYKQGSDPETDLAVEKVPGLEKFCSQDRHETVPAKEAMDRLYQQLRGGRAGQGGAPQPDEAGAGAPVGGGLRRMPPAEIVETP